MRRPAGVTIVAIVCFLAAAFIVLTGIRLFARDGFMATLFSQGSDSGVASGLAELGAASILLVITFTALYALAGWGLWKLKNWGRILTIFLMAIGFVFRLLLWYLTPYFKMSNFLATVVTLVLYGVTALYLFKPEVKATFPSS